MSAAMGLFCCVATPNAAFIVFEAEKIQTPLSDFPILNILVATLVPASMPPHQYSSVLLDTVFERTYSRSRPIHLRYSDINKSE